MECLPADSPLLSFSPWAFVFWTSAGLLVPFVLGHFGSRRFAAQALWTRGVYALSGLPLLALATAGALFLRLRLALGHWPYWDPWAPPAESVGVDPWANYDPQHHAMGFETHMLIAQGLVLGVLVLIPPFAAFFLGGNVVSSKTWKATGIYLTTAGLLLVLRLSDPGGQFDWLLE